MKKKISWTDVVSPVLTVTKGGTTTSYTPGLSERNMATQVSRFYHADLKRDFRPPPRRFPLLRKGTGFCLSLGDKIR
ncbi:MAG TPA: hypothetical protein VNK96_09735 [Fimbriimonadales bacterium]|nr:hypothetical protein [Fimbriimonadales bacterium]